MAVRRFKIIRPEGGEHRGVRIVSRINTINRLFLDKRNIVNLSLISITLVDPIQRVEVKQILDFKLKYL